MDESSEGFFLGGFWFWRGEESHEEELRGAWGWDFGGGSDVDVERVQRGGGGVGDVELG